MPEGHRASHCDIALLDMSCPDTKPGRMAATTGPGRPQLVLDSGENCGRHSAYIPMCPTIQTAQNATTNLLLLAALTRERRTVIAAIAVASFVTGAAVGWLLTMIAASAAMSFSQERMQRKVRYWQAETALARAQAKAERLAREAITPGNPPPRPGD